MTVKLLVVENLVKEYPTPGEPLRVLAGASFELAAGESVSITGPSGSGKSTLLNIIGALDIPTEGTVAFDGRSVHELDPRAAAAFRNGEVGFVFQDHHLLPQLNAVENVLLPCLAFGKAGPDAVARAGELLDAVGLGDRRTHFPHEMSGGQRQRVAIARALVNRPRLILCDEPTGDLDVGTARNVADLILTLRDREGVAAVVVTHNEAVAGMFGRRLALDDGVLVE